MIVIMGKEKREKRGILQGGEAALGGMFCSIVLVIIILKLSKLVNLSKYYMYSSPGTKIHTTFFTRESTYFPHTRPKKKNKTYHLIYRIPTITTLFIGNP